MTVKKMSEQQQKDDNNDEKISHLVKLYRNPKSNIFLSRNSGQIYKDLRNENFKISYHDIYRLKNTVESLSRGRETRLLHGKRRSLGYRRFLCFSPCHIVLGWYYSK